jgi:hypothetical protein
MNTRPQAPAGTPSPTAPAVPPAIDLLQLGPRRTVGWRAAPGTRLTVQSGRIWLTENGADGDRFVAAGQSVELRGDGRVVIECDSSEPAQLAVISPRRGLWAKLAARIAPEPRWWLAMDDERLRDVGAPQALMQRAGLARDLERRCRERLLRWQGVHS